ncbi:hypothetical protein H4219_002280 [Mycoemilia scoparia]|uniref:Tetrapyrrole biosynthesis uroporphyrinogen III synthase domain-containing protein n=1 Tax=Mycoemilia scoparia TaxID=417184 RepID=A0A9W8A4E2_9FUNG|nr:hypothetical protein H4219_002280 [Mycoemilia scoparia]
MCRQLVVLFRDPTKKSGSSTTTKQDIGILDYELEFNNNGYDAISIPVIRPQFDLITPAFEDILKQAGRFTGIVFTSVNSIRSLYQTYQKYLVIHYQNKHNTTIPEWQLLLSLPIFVVGEATARECEKLLTTSPSLQGDDGDDHKDAKRREYPKLNIIGKESGSAKEMRPTIPDGLKSLGIPFTEIAAYKTIPQDPKTIAKSFPQEGRSCPGWLVFYSPSGVDPVLSAIENISSSSSSSSNGGIILPRKASTQSNKNDNEDAETNGSRVPNVKIAAIGPTTSNHLYSLGYIVDAVAKLPTPKHLVEAISAFDKKQHI